MSAYYIEDYWTGDIIDIASDFDTAKAICDLFDGSQVTTETDEVLYTNITLPF